MVFPDLFNYFSDLELAFYNSIFTVVCSEEPKHLNRVEGGGDVVLLQTSCFSPANDNVPRLVSMGILKLICT